jgi:hypothetical protein
MPDRAGARLRLARPDGVDQRQVPKALTVAGIRQMAYVQLEFSLFGQPPGFETL